MSDLVTLGFKADTRGLLGAQRELDKTTAAGARLDKQSAALTKTLGLVGAAITAVGVTAGTRQIIQYADSWANLNTQLRQVTKSEQELVNVRSQLLAVSRDTRIDLDATVGLYTEMTRGTSELGISSEKLLGITKTLNNLFLAGGKPLSEMTGAIRQLNQGFASGVLRGDEFNSVAEGAPRILDAMAAKLNMTRGELRAFAATGGITAGVMVEALADFEGTAQKLADTVKITFEQTMGLVQTNITEFVGQNELLTGSVDSLGSSLLSLSENLDALAYSLGAAGAVIATAYGVKLTSALYGSVTATYAKIKADGEALIAQRTLEMQTAKTALTQAKASAAEANIALKSQAANVARLRSSIAAFDAEFALEAQRQKAQISEIGRIQSGLRMSEINASRAIVTNQLTASETALAAAMARTSGVENVAALGKVKLTAATQAVTAATVAQTASARALGAATSFLMGPWGVLIAAVGIGAAAFLTSSENIDKATESANRHAKAMSELETIYSKWNKTRLEDERNKLLERSNEILFERLDIEEKIQKLSANATTQRGMETIVNPEVLAEIEELEKSLASLADENENIDNSLSKVLDVLDTFITKKKEATTTVDKSIDSNRKLADSYNSQILSLHNQRTALQMTGDEFEIYTAKQTALMYGATEEMLENVEKQVKALQKSRKEFELFANFEETMNAPDWLANITDNTASSLDELESKIDNFGGAWSRTGNIIIDAFGDMGDAMNSYMQSMDELSSMQKELDEERNKAGADSVKLNKLEQKINEKKVSAELSGYKALANGAAGMFSEKTAAAKAFTAISQVLAVTEIALSYQKMAASTTETATHVANETTKQGANALTAITSAFAAPFPVNFAVGAAMISIMASLLGGSFGGGGSSYEMPDEGGTGTVLGDPTAQSASISNVSDRYEDIELDQLAELKGIRDSMTKLSSGIQELAKSFVTDLNFTGSDLQLENSNFLDTGLGSTLRKIDPVAKVADWIDAITGDFLGLGGIVDKVFGGFSSKKQKLIDSGITFMTQTMAGIFESGELDASMYNVIETTKKKFWGLSKKKSTSTETQSLGGVINAQMGEIFGYLGESVIAAAESLGMDTKHIITTGIESLGLEDALKTFVIDIGDVSFLDKTGEEIQKELEAIFSQQGDLMAEYLVPSIKEYQQVGEGAFETLQRVAYEQAVFNDSLERTGKSLSSLSNLMQIDVAQSVIAMTGGIENFAKLSNEYFESFYSESQQFEYLQHSLSEAFGSLGMSIAGSREQFKSMIDGIDLTTESGQRLYASLLELVPGMDEYLSQLEDLASDKLNLQIDLLNAQGKSSEALALSRQMELDATDESLHAIIKQIWALEDAAKAEEERTAELEAAQRLQDQATNLHIRLLNEMGESEEALALSRQVELAGMDESLRAMMELIYAQQDMNKERDKEIAALDELKSTLENNVAFAEQQLEKARQAEIGRLNQVIAKAEEAYNLEIEVINKQRSAYKDLLDELESGVDNAVNEVEKARQAEIDKINLTVTRAQQAYDFELESINKQREAYNAFIAELESKANAAESALDASLSAELAKYDKLIEAVNSKASAEIEALNDVSSARLSALNEERGIVAGIASELGKASKSFTAAQALSAARRGDFNPAGNIALGDGYTDEISARVGQGREAFALNEIGKLADAQLSDLDRTIAATESATERQIAAINSGTESQVRGLEAQKLAIEDQVKAALGIDESVLSLDVALAQYQAAQDELQRALAENTLEELQSQEEIALQAFEQAKADAQAQIDALNTQVDALLGIDNSVLSLIDATELFTSAQNELNKALNDDTLEKLQAQEDLAREAFEQAKSDTREQIAALNAQIDGLLNIDNSVMSVQAAIELLAAERQALEDLNYDAQLEQLNELYKLNSTVTDIFNKGTGDDSGSSGSGTTGDLADLPRLDRPIDDHWPIMDPVVELASEVREANSLAREAQQSAQNANRAIAKNTASTAKILQRLEINNESRSVL